mgnify:CR=1 FL=1
MTDEFITTKEELKALIRETLEPLLVRIVNDAVSEFFSEYKLVKREEQGV